jgi:enoyl-CoA hydratase/carnithine racemase
LDKSAEDIENIVWNLRRIFNDVRNIHCPVICVIDGPALGGGLELALNADIRIATKNSLIGLPETYWSLIPGAGGTQTLARTIGVAKAKELIFTARKLNGEQAR